MFRISAALAACHRRVDRSGAVADHSCTIFAVGMRERMMIKTKLLFGFFACMALVPDIAAAQTINVGAASTTSDAPIYIADNKGFFRDEGIDVKVTNFR